MISGDIVDKNPSPRGAKCWGKETANQQMKTYNLSDSINAGEQIQAGQEDRECWGGSECWGCNFKEGAHRWPYLEDDI